MPTGGDIGADAIKTQIPNALESLRTLFSGPSEPGNPTAYMLWAHTTTGLLKQRDETNASWIVVARLGADWNARTVLLGELATLSASRFLFLPPMGLTAEVLRIVLVSDTATTSSSGNEWQFELHNRTQTLELFSGDVGTFTELAGVGGGVEIAANTPFILVPDQNQVVATGDVLELVIAKVGTATTLDRVSVFAEVTTAA